MATACRDILQTFAGDLPHRAFLNLGYSSAADALAWQAPQDIGGDGRAWNVNLQSTVQAAHLSELDGDGLADLAVKALTGEAFYFPNEGRLNWGNRQLMSVTDVAPPSPFGQPGVRSADLDFDKGMDILQSLNLGGAVVYRIWFNLGDQRYAPSMITAPAEALDLTDPTVQIADLNGDRVPDLARVQAERVQVLTGLGYGRFTETAVIALPGANLTADQVRQARLTDLTGDGLADLVLERAAPGQLWYWINRGNYEFGNRKEVIDLPLLVGQGAVVRWADMNGNGTTDLVYADATALPRLRTVEIGELINRGATPNVLVSIANGLGRITTVEYRSSVEFRLADQAAGHSSTNPMPISVPVVSRVTVDDSLGHQYVTDFHYHDGYYDTEQKQFRGFARVEHIEVGDATAPTLVTRHHFDTGQRYEPMKGRLLRQSAEEADGRVYWEETVDWTLPPRILDLGTNGQVISFAHPIRQSRVIKELGQGVERRTESEMEFDQYGNQTLEASYGVVEDGNRAALFDERIAATEYALNLDAWLLRFPRRQETRDLEGNVISRTEYYYDDATFSGDNPGVVTRGNLTLQRAWIDPADPVATIESARYLHDPYGNAIASLDPLAVAPGGLVDPAAGHVRTVEYDGHFHTYAVAETVHPGAGAAPLVFRATYDEAFGSLITATDFNTNTTLHTYDVFARLTSILKPGDTPEYPTSEYLYALAVPAGPQGLVNYVQSRLLDQSPGSRPTHRDHYLISREFTDGLGRKLMVKKEAESPEGDARPTVVVSSAVTFNARRTAALALNPFFSLAFDDGDDGLAFESIENPAWRGLFHESGNLVSLGLAEAHKTASIYDATLRERRSINPDGTFEITAYEPLLTRSYDANQSNPASPHFGAHLAHLEDGLGRLIRVDENVRIEDDGTPADTLNTWTTRYEYDLNDQLTRITDSLNNVKLMAYDGLTRKVSLNDPDRGLMRFTYDAAGNLIETVDAKGQRITYTFDGANRMRTEDYHDGNPQLPEFDPSQPITPANRPDVAFFYDVPTLDLDLGDGTRLTALNTAGMLACVWDLTGEEHYSYDARERTTTLVKRIRDPLHGHLVSYHTGYTFDALDRLQRVQYPDDDFVQYEYDQRGLGSRILGGPTGQLISNLRYSPAGQLTRIEYGNGVQTQSAYDSNLRLVRMRTRQTQLDLEHVAYDYEFDAASNFRAIVDQRPGSAVPDVSPPDQQSSGRHRSQSRSPSAGLPGRSTALSNMPPFSIPPRSPQPETTGIVPEL